MHRTVMSSFPNAPGSTARSGFGVLYRVEAGLRDAGPYMLVQSSAEPQWSRLPTDYVAPGERGRPNPEVKRIAERYGELCVGMRLRFRLLANPTRKIDTRSGPDGTRRHGRRVELRGEAARLDWLARKAGQHGFELTNVRASAGVRNALAGPAQRIAGRREKEVGREPVTLATVLFEGELLITDAEAFRRALSEGIGPGKAYGCGLLSIAPPSP
jgi:CRISPR system Cascade subunit CasE